MYFVFVDDKGGEKNYMMSENEWNSMLWAIDKRLRGAESYDMIEQRGRKENWWFAYLILWSYILICCA